MTILVSTFKRIITSARLEALGWPLLIVDRVFKKLGLTEIRLKPKGTNWVTYRVTTADILEYSQSLGHQQVPLHLPIRPEFIVDAGANVGYSALDFKRSSPVLRSLRRSPEQDNIIHQKEQQCSFDITLVAMRAGVSRLHRPPAVSSVRSLD
jgi:hypothetical protein